MKRVTMELGGHAPAIVFDDADVDAASRLLAAAKFRNAGQVCVSPTRLLVQEKVYEQFVEGFVAAQPRRVKVGDGLEAGTTMGPLANAAPHHRDGDVHRRCHRRRAATVHTGGNRIGNKGNFFEPTVLTDVPKDARVMNEEPFGPLAIISPFRGHSMRWWRRPTGCRTASPPTPIRARPRPPMRSPPRSRAGMISINHHGLALPEVPFGGVKDSGYGSEGGPEAIEGYLNTKFVTQAGL